MEEEELDLRPAPLLDEYRRWSGLTGTRMGDPETMTLSALVGDVDTATGEIRPRWRTLAIEHDPMATLAKGYHTYIEQLQSDYEAGKGRDTRQLLALALVGFGKAIIRRRDGVEPDAELMKDYADLYALSERGDWADAQVVHLISPEGIAMSTVMKYPDGTVHEEALEAWSEGDPEEFARVRDSVEGGLLDALVACFGTLILLNQAVEDGNAPDFRGLVGVAMNHKNHPGGGEMVNLIRSFVGQRLDEAAQLGALLAEMDDQTEGWA